MKDRIFRDYFSEGSRVFVGFGRLSKIGMGREREYSVSGVGF